MLIAAASQGHWYTSGTFYGAAGAIAVVVFGAISIWVTLLVGSTRRRLTYSLADDTPLLARTTALAPADLEVLYQGQRLDAPRVVSVRLVSRGRRDIGTDDFDGRRPLAIDLCVPIVKLLATDPAPELPQSAIRVEGSRLMLGPCRFRKRQVLSFAFLVDGDRPRLSHEDYLLNVDVRESVDSGELSRRTQSRAAALAVTVAESLIGLVMGAAMTTGVVAVAAHVTGTESLLTQGLSAAAVIVTMPVTVLVAVPWLERQRLLHKSAIQQADRTRAITASTAESR